MKCHELRKMLVNAAKVFNSGGKGQNNEMGDCMKAHKVVMNPPLMTGKVHRRQP